MVLTAQTKRRVAYRSGDQVVAKRVGVCLNSMLCGTVDGSTRVCFVGCNGGHHEHVAPSTLHHAGHDELGHRHHAEDVRVDHLLAVLHAQTSVKLHGSFAEVHKLRKRVSCTMGRLQIEKHVCL